MTHVHHNTTSPAAIPGHSLKSYPRRRPPHPPLPTATNQGHSSEAGESQKKTDKETPMTKADWNGSSLFIKRSPIWKALQEMEVFQKFPQNPHFHSLEGLKESSREGLAIGNMVTFANVVNEAFKLKFSDSVGSINACLETLLELEVHGFDITPIREHLKKLLLVKEEQEKLRDKKKEVENRVVDLMTEKVQTDEEIVEFDNEIKRLKEQRAAAKSREEEKSLKIGELNVKVASIAELIDGAASLNAEDLGDYYLKVSSFL